MVDHEPGSERNASTNGGSWLPTAGAIVLLLLVVAFGLCAGFCGTKCK